MANIYSKRFIVNALAITIYLAYWLYALYFFYYKEYDNGYAAATAALGIGAITLALTLGYFFAYLLKALKAGSQQRFYWLVLLVISLPGLGVLLVELARQLSAPTGK